jgi:hypothetical protein
VIGHWLKVMTRAEKDAIRIIFDIPKIDKIIERKPEKFLLLFTFKNFGDIEKLQFWGDLLK